MRKDNISVEETFHAFYVPFPKCMQMKKHLYGGLNCKAELATIFHETLFLLERTIDKQIIVIHTWVLERHFPEK